MAAIADWMYGCGQAGLIVGFNHNSADRGRTGCRFQQPGQGINTLTDEGAVGRGSIIRQAIPGRKFQSFNVWSEEAQGLVHTGQMDVITGDENTRIHSLANDVGKNQGVIAAGRSRNVNDAGC